MQFKSGNADRKVEASLALDRNRLQRDGAVRAANQHVGACAKADSCFGACAGIGASQRTKAPRCRGIDRPYHLAAGGGTDIKAKLVDRSEIHLARSRLGWREDAAHSFLRSQDQPDAT